MPWATAASSIAAFLVMLASRSSPSELITDAIVAQDAPVATLDDRPGRRGDIAFRPTAPRNTFRASEPHVFDYLRDVIDRVHAPAFSYRRVPPAWLEPCAAS